MDKKPGYKTTEFWLSLLAMIVGALLASGIVSDGGTFDKVLGVAALILGQLGYTVSRTAVKKKEVAANSAKNGVS